MDLRRSSDLLTLSAICCTLTIPHCTYYSFPLYPTIPHCTLFPLTSTVRHCTTLYDTVQFYWPPLSNCSPLYRALTSTAPHCTSLYRALTSSVIKVSHCIVTLKDNIFLNSFNIMFSSKFSSTCIQRLHKKNFTGLYN